jgi:WD40 repeat protein
MAWRKITAGLLIIGTSLAASSQELLPVGKALDLTPAWTSKIDQSLYSVAWSPDGQFLAIGGRGKVRIFRPPEFTLIRTIETDQQEIWGLKWSPNGQLLACAGKDGTLQIWQEDKLQKKFVQGGWITDLAWNPDGASLMAVDFTGLAKEWDVEGFLRASIQLDADGLGVDWSPKGRLFAVSTGHNASRLLLFDSESGELKWRRQDVPAEYKAPFGYGLDEVNGVRYSPNGRWIATAHQDGRILVDSAEDGSPVFSAQLHQPGLGGSRRLAWSPDGNWIISSGEDGRVNLVRYPNGKDRLDLIDDNKAIWSVAWSPDNRWIAAAGDEGRVWVWSTASIPLGIPQKAVSSGSEKPTKKNSTESKHRKRPSAVKRAKRAWFDLFPRMRQ